MRISIPDVTEASTLCFTGHRPEKLPFKGEASAAFTYMLKSLIYQEILQAEKDGYNCFVTGLSRGVDLWAGEIILREIGLGKKICLVSAMPYNDFGKDFIGYDKWIRGNILSKSERIYFMSDQCSRDAIMDRNRFMVENSSRIIAVVKNYRSGTGATISMAKKNKLDTRIIDVNKLENMYREFSGDPEYKSSFGEVDLELFSSSEPDRVIDMPFSKGMQITFDDLLDSAAKDIKERENHGKSPK